MTIELTRGGYTRIGLGSFVAGIRLEKSPFLDGKFYAYVINERGEEVDAERAVWNVPEIGIETEGRARKLILARDW